ncbi:MAG: GtrA family protein [Parcubacteria group bacterium]|nr:GtrA family protein [Parcubacteria group bacterium]
MKILSKYPIILQILKFGVTGVMNTGIDFLVLNGLMWATSTYSGTLIILLNAVSFSVAVTNSYLWNKYWTFKVKAKDEIPQEFVKFITVSIIGAIINSSILFAFTTFVEPVFGLSEGLWANVGKLFATGIALVWNFIGYKFWALKIDKK